MIYGSTNCRLGQSVYIHFQDIINLIVAKTGAAAKGNGRQFSMRCPAHEDTRASLSVSEGHDRRVLLFCHAGCTIKAICDALGIKEKDLFPKNKIGARHG
ncbi:MAG: hypothetical protein K2X90_00940 [Candidatus Babeliaceae bacterium]|nr:hypothetical protein [Candidatus Babeliaceae bacterium]